jgi:hypothetical protein
MNYIVIDLPIAGEGHTQTTLGSTQVELVTRFNYSIPAWIMDILDSAGNLMIAGLTLVPKVNILKPYPELTSLGSLVLVELNDGDHQNPSLLGSQVQLLWFPVGAAIVLP